MRADLRVKLAAGFSSKGSSEVCRFVYNGERSMASLNAAPEAISKSLVRLVKKRTVLEAENRRFFSVSVSDSLDERSQAHRLLRWEGSWQAGEDMFSELSCGLWTPGVLAWGSQPGPLTRKRGQIWVKGVLVVMSALGEICNMEWPYFIFWHGTSEEHHSTLLNRLRSVVNLGPFSS